MSKIITLLFCILLTGCNNDSNAEKGNHHKSADKSNNYNFVNIIALNKTSCLLEEKGNVFCWEPVKSGALNVKALKPVDLGSDTRAVSIFGRSGEMSYFDTGYHACALLENNTIRCWGKITDDTVFDADSIFDLSNKPTNETDQIHSFPVKDNILKKMGKVTKILTGHSVVCSINTDNLLYCPHEHLLFLNGKAVKNAVFGEILSCIQRAEDNEIQCFDMRGNSNQNIIFTSLAGEAWPALFDMRFVYSEGITFIKKDGNALFWEGKLPLWDKFPDIYDIETKPVNTGTNNRSEAVYMSDKTTCLKLSNGTATCWGPFIRGSSDDAKLVQPPGKIYTFSDNRSIKEIALGNTYNCFLLNDHSVECFIWN